MSSGSCKKSFPEAWSSLSIQTDLVSSPCCNVFFPLVSGRASSSIFYFTCLRTRTKSYAFVIFKTRGLCSPCTLQRLKASVPDPPVSCSLLVKLWETMHSARSIPVLHTHPYEHCFLHFLSSEGCCLCINTERWG